MKGLNYLLVLILIGVTLSCTFEGEKMVLPKDLEVVNMKSENDTVCFSCAHQVVVFSNFDEISFYPFSEKYLWYEIREQFPEIGFIFYFSGRDKVKLTRDLAELGFPFPVIHDPEFRFYKENNLDTISSTYDVLHAFHVKNGFYTIPAQIGMQKKFIEELEEIL